MLKIIRVVLLIVRFQLVVKKALRNLGLRGCMVSDESSSEKDKPEDVAFDSHLASGL